MLVLDAAAAVVAAAPHAARMLLRPGELLPLLLHGSADVRAAAAPVITHLVRMSDASCARLARRWLTGGPCRQLSARPVPAPRSAAALLTPATLGDELHCCREVSAVGNLCKNDDTVDALVSTPHCEAALSSLALALASSRPVLLSGAAGCGKSALVGELARRLGQRE